MSISQEILAEFKDRMHIGDDEDNNLESILSVSEAELKRVCGDYDIDIDGAFKELVFERSRYVYNDALEFFNANFLNQINSLGIEKALLEIVLDTTTTSSDTTANTTVGDSNATV